MTRSTKVREEQTLQFRVEFFNGFNHPHFGNPGTARDVPNTFGIISTTSTNPRLIQFALRCRF